MNNNSAHFGGYLALFAAGTVIGGAAALLYAPRSGRATRHLLARGARDLKNKTTDTIEDLKERVMDKIAEVKTVAMHM
jgi:gas vesicle protein